MGCFRIGLILFLVLAMVVESSFRVDHDAMVDTARSGGGNVIACTGHVGECIKRAEGMMLVDVSESVQRRNLGSQGYVSYDALRANNVPCNRRGQSYYNCNQRANDNPYRRGCSYITKCARYTG